MFEKCVVSKMVKAIMHMLRNWKSRQKKLLNVYTVFFKSWYNPSSACFWLTFYDVHISGKDFVAFFCFECKKNYVWANCLGSASLWCCSCHIVSMSGKFIVFIGMLYVLSQALNFKFLTRIAHFGVWVGKKWPLNFQQSFL